MKSSSELQRTEIKKTDTNIVVSQEKKVQKVVKEVRKTDQTIKENEGEIIIKGKTDSLTDFHFHNIVNGDTLSDIGIKGNAEFYIKNRFKNNETEVLDSVAKENLNVVAKVARKAVAASTIKEVAEEIKSSKTDVKAKGFSLPIYLIIGGAVVLLILLYFFFGDLKKFVQKITERNI